MTKNVEQQRCPLSAVSRPQRQLGGMPVLLGPPSLSASFALLLPQDVPRKEHLFSTSLDAKETFTP